MFQKIIYNFFVFLWFFLGFLIFTWQAITFFANGKFNNLELIAKIKVLLPWGVLAIYLIAYAKHLYMLQKQKLQK